MECRQATDLLPLFMDDALDQDTRRSLQEHLDACPHCRSELGKLQSLAQDLRAHGMMKAPDDFLEKLHARTRGSRLKEFLRLLFYPLHVKIPVEVVGLASVAVIIFSLFHAVEPEVRMTVPQGVSSDAGNVREQAAPQESRPGPLTPETAPITEKGAIPSLSTTPEEATPRKQAVRPYDKKQEAVPAKIDQAGAGTPPQPIDVYIVMRGIEKLQTEESAGAGVQAPAPSEAKSRDALRAVQAPAARVAAEAEDHPLTATPEGPVLSSLKDIIASVQGSLINVDYDEKSHNPSVLTARVPTGALHEFFQRIRDVAELETPAPSVLPTGGGDCLVRIHLAPEETRQK